jgi:hypothetical protein
MVTQLLYGDWEFRSSDTENWLPAVEDKESRVSIFIVNDSMSSWESQLHWSLETIEGGMIEAEDVIVNIPSQSS